MSRIQTNWEMMVEISAARTSRVRCCWKVLIAGVCLTFSHLLVAHGSVVEDGDLCLIRIGFYQAHFTIYQPRSAGHEEGKQNHGVPSGYGHRSRKVLPDRRLHKCLSSGRRPGRELPADGVGWPVIRCENRGFRAIFRVENESIGSC